MLIYGLHNFIIQEDGCGITAEREGYDSAESAFLHHRMKYSSHGNDPLLAIERYTHSMSSANDLSSTGPETINVSITCTRLPQKQEIVRQVSDLSVHKPSVMTTSGQIWRRSLNANPREKGRDFFQKATVSTHPPVARPVSRASELEKAVYSTNGAIKTDNHRRSTSLPSQPLIQPTGLKQATTTSQHTHHFTETSQTQQNLMTRAPSSAYKQQDSDTVSLSLAHSAMTDREEGELTPSKSLRIYLSSHTGPSIAPAGVRAVATHRIRPVTNSTMIKGRGLVTVAR